MSITLSTSSERAPLPSFRVMITSTESDEAYKILAVQGSIFIILVCVVLFFAHQGNDLFLCFQNDNGANSNPHFSNTVIRTRNRHGDTQSQRDQTSPGMPNCGHRLFTAFLSNGTIHLITYLYGILATARVTILFSMVN